MILIAITSSKKIKTQGIYKNNESSIATSSARAQFPGETIHIVRAADWEGWYPLLLNTLSLRRWDPLNKPVFHHNPCRSRFRIEQRDCDSSQGVIAGLSRCRKLPREHYWRYSSLDEQYKENWWDNGYITILRGCANALRQSPPHNKYPKNSMHVDS